MSTEDSVTPGDETPRPRTRAEARAMREAASRSLSEERSDESKRGDVPEDPHDVSSRSARSTTDGADPALTYPGAATSAAPQSRAAAEAKRGDAPAGRNRFGIALGAVLGILVLAAAGLSAASLFQGPRIASVSVDPAAAIEDSGTRLIIDANQPLSEVDPAQVTVEPAIPFTVDTAGRGLGIRFTVPLDDDTEYTVTATDVIGANGGPSGTLTTSFRTPASQIFLLQRSDDGDDAIFRTDLTGEKAVPVYKSERITDFRTTANRLVVATEHDGVSTIQVMNRDGSDPEELPLPGTGYATGLQVSERGGLVGYTYTDKNLSATEGRASVLVTQPLSGGDPVIVELPDGVPSIAEWQFVPDSAAALFLDFTGMLYVDDRSGDTGPVPLGLTQSIEGISRGTYTAIVQRDYELLELNLEDGSTTPLPPSTPDFGVPKSIIPFPGGTIQHVTSRDDAGMPTGQSIIRVDDDGAAETLYSVSGTDIIVQECVSPSGQYTAVTVAPDLVNNPYDHSLLPLPKSLQTHILDTRTGDEVVPLAGFDTSWCAMGPRP